MLRQQTERTVFMTDFDSTIDDFYKSLALQFGYITIFAIYYPAVTVYAMIANLIHILFLVTSYNFYTRRPLSQPIKGIGAYNEILGYLTVVAIIYNAFVLIYPTNGASHYFDDIDLLRDFKFILIVLACIFAAKIIAESQIPRISQWLRVQLNREKESYGNMNLPFFRKADAIFIHTEKYLKELIHYNKIRNEVYMYKTIRMRGDYRITDNDIVIDRYH